MVGVWLYCGGAGLYCCGRWDFTVVGGGTLLWWGGVALLWWGWGFTMMVRACRTFYWVCFAGAVTGLSLS